MTTSTTTGISDQFPSGAAQPIASFDELGPGLQFPPERERTRIYQYDRWYRWSERSYIGLEPAAPGESQTRFDITGRRQVRRLAPNLFRFLMNFWGDAVAVDAPVVEYEGGGRQQEVVDALMPALMKASRLVVQDMVRYGCGVFYSRHALRPECLDPRFWFPVRPLHDPHAMQGDAVAYPFSSKPQSVNDRLYMARHHADGRAEAAVYGLDGLTVGGSMEAVDLAGVEGQVVPVVARDGVYGRSDFEDAAEYVQELHRRESAISEALDRHANPHLAVPEGSLTTNADGSVTVNVDGMVIPVPEGSAMPAYIVWEPQFQAQQEGIGRAEQRILRFSQIAPILATPGEFALRGGLPSGAALRRLAVISVNRLKAIREELTSAWMRVIPANVMLLAEQGGERVSFDADRLRVEWPPEFSSADEPVAEEGLPGGDADDADDAGDAGPDAGGARQQRPDAGEMA